MFYIKLALKNIKQSLSTFVPFILSSVVLYSIICSTFLIMFSPIADKMKQSQTIFTLAIIVLAIFAVVMEIYSFNFLIKQRSKEFGLYNILGMKKRQISLLSSIELFNIFILLLIFGSLVSAVLSNVLYVIFINITHINLVPFKISLTPFLMTSALFCAIFLLIEVINLFAIYKTSPLALFQRQEKGEKEPKGNFFFAIISVILLAIGYYISLSSKGLSALDAIMKFFAAVMFVIVGTYMFYISFTTWYLKYKRQNKNYYYKPKNFITLSQMIFRMKQNAVGLASITLLATMSFVTIATSAALYGTTEIMAKNLFPKNTTVYFNVQNKKDGDKLYKELILDKFGEKTKGDQIINTDIIPINLTDSKIVKINEDSLTNLNPTETAFVYIVTRDDLIKAGNSLPEIKDDEYMFFANQGNTNISTINFFGKSFKVIENLKKVNFAPMTNTYNSGVWVVSNYSILENIINTNAQELSKILKNQPVMYFTNQYIVYTDINKEDLLKISDDQGNIVGPIGELVGRYKTKQDYLDTYYISSGGFLFVGFLLGVSFLLGAALIIYYKQYSEGHEDKKSYTILQEIGMDKKSIQETINSQTIFVFFMPIVIATAHFIASLTIIKQMLLLFGIGQSNDSNVNIISTATIISIVLIYFIVYKITSFTYYRIIKR